MDTVFTENRVCAAGRPQQGQARGLGPADEDSGWDVPWPLTGARAQRSTPPTGLRGAGKVPIYAEV